MFCALSDEPAACQSSIAALLLAKSETDWFCAYSALLGLTILSLAMNPMYRLTAATFSGVSNVAFPDGSNQAPPYCWLKANAWWMFSAAVAPPPAKPPSPPLGAFLPSSTDAAHLRWGAGASGAAGGVSLSQSAR